HARTGAIVGVLLIAILVGFSIWHRRAGAGCVPPTHSPSRALAGLCLDGPSPRWLQLGFLSVTAILFLCSLYQSWNRIDIASDSDSYVNFYAIRTPLYPWLIALLDRQDQREALKADNTIKYDNPDHRYLSVIHFQKLFWVGSLVVLLG